MPEPLDPLGTELGGAGEAGDVPTTPALPLAAAASLIGGYRWIEQRLFELLGGWAAEAARPELGVHLDAQSARHAWHASLWADRLPVRDGVSADELTVAPPGAAEALDELGRAGSATVPVVAGLYRVVLPRLVVGYSRHLRAASPVGDAPVIRALRLVLADEVEDWHAGERVVQGLLDHDDQVASAAALHQRLESLVIEAGAGRAMTGWGR